MSLISKRKGQRTELFAKLIEGSIKWSTWRSTPECKGIRANGNAKRGRTDLNNCKDG